MICMPTGLSHCLKDHGHPQAMRRATRSLLALPIADQARADVQRETDALTPPEQRR